MYLLFTNNHKRFDLNLTLSASMYYPKIFSKTHRDSKRHNVVLLGIGGNQPQTPKAFRNLIRVLYANPNISHIESSSLLENPAFGFIHQPSFINATLFLRTAYTLTELYALVFYLERRFGRPRKRAFKNAPRIIDIDIIFFNTLILKRGYLTIPHPHWQNRESVCIPMSFMKFH